MSALSGLTVLVTGANRGIGLALCQRFAELGSKVIGVCRSTSAELAAVPSVRVVDGVDVSQDDCGKVLVEKLGAGTRIDVLVNNAGVLVKDKLDTATADELRHQFNVNVVGPLLVTQALVPLLHSGSKVAVITSRMGSIADNGSGGYYGYRASKAAVNAVGMSLARDLQPRGIAVALLHPGFVATDMTAGKGAVSPNDSARMLVDRIAELTLDRTGVFWHANGEVLPW